MLVLAMALALMMAQQPTGTQWSKIPLPTADDFPGARHGARCVGIGQGTMHRGR